MIVMMVMVMVLERMKSSKLSYSGSKYGVFYAAIAHLEGIRLLNLNDCPNIGDAALVHLAGVDRLNVDRYKLITGLTFAYLKSYTMTKILSYLQLHKHDSMMMSTVHNNTHANCSDRHTATHWKFAQSTKFNFVVNTKHIFCS